MAMTLTSDTTIVFTRVFDAPPERVFDAWTRCEDLMQWWGPREWPLAHCDMDLSVGGTWHYMMRGPAGEESWGIWTFREIDRPRKIGYTDSFSDADRAVIPPTSDGDVTFEPKDGSTYVTITATYPKAEDLKTVIEMGMEAGLEETLDRLAELLAK